MDSIYISNPQLTSSHPSQSHPLIASQVKQAYEKLHKNINEMQGKVQNVISKHESQFLLAYRTHMTKIKRELGEIKKRSEDQEKMFSSNDRIKFLEKEIAVFREEAILVYDKLQKTNNQLELYKRKFEDTLRMSQLAQRDIKQSIKYTKNISASQTSQQKRIQQLQTKLEQKQKQILRLTRKDRRENHANLLGSIGSERSYNRYNNHSNLLQSSKFESTSRKSNAVDSSPLSETNFRDIFFKCVKSLKKQIALRKNLDKITIGFNPKDRENMSIQEFREVDKIKVLELFFSDAGLEMWLYEKLFPNALFRKLEVKNERQEAGERVKGLFQLTSTGFALPKVRQNQRRHASKLETKNQSFI